MRFTNVVYNNNNNSIENYLNFNATKSYCMIFTPRNYKRFIPPFYLSKLPVLYTDFIKYLGYTFSSNNCDNNDMLKQMRMLYCRLNRLVILFSLCSKPVLLELCRSFCTVFHCSYFWTNYKKQGRQTGGGVGGVSTPPEFWMGG